MNEPIYGFAEKISGTLDTSIAQRISNKNKLIIVVNRGTEEIVRYDQRRSPKWNARIKSGIVLKGGDKLTITYTFEGQTSTPRSVTVTRGKNEDFETLTVPKYDIKIELPGSIQEEEMFQADEFLGLLKAKNPGLEAALDKDNPISINVNNSSFTLKYSDGSSLTYKDDNFTISVITEVSVTPHIEELTVMDNKIMVTFDRAVDPKTKIHVFFDVPPTECNTDDCQFDKSYMNPKDWGIVGGDAPTKTYTYQLNDSEWKELKSNAYIGIGIKELLKKRQCNKTTPHLVEPEVPVRDPRKLTDDDKTKIENAIREKNTKGDVSKLPAGTGFKQNIPAFIEFDKDGNVRIINPNNVKGSWSDGKFIPLKNQDGTYQLDDENDFVKFPAEDILRNLKPDAPKIELDEEDNVVVTPQKVDTDAATITLSYNDLNGIPKKLVATKATEGEDAGKWSITEGSDGSVDENTGAVSLPSDKVENGGTVKATVTDNGGIADDDTTKLESDEAPLPLEKKHKVSYNAGEAGDEAGTMPEKYLKKGEKYTILENGFKAPEGKEFDHWQIGEDAKKPGDEITIGEDDIVITAIWKTTPTESKKPDTPDDATTPTDTPDDATVPTTTPTPQETEPTGSTGEPEPTGSSDKPQPTETVPEPETTSPDMPENPHSPGNWISPDPSDDWRNQTPLEGQKTPGSVQVIQQQSAPSAAPAPTTTEKNAKGLPRTGENPSLLIQSLAILLVAGGALALMQRRKSRIRR